jgi:hypothetical protein
LGWLTSKVSVRDVAGTTGATTGTAGAAAGAAALPPEELPLDDDSALVDAAVEVAEYAVVDALLAKYCALTLN